MEASSFFCGCGTGGISTLSLKLPSCLLNLGLCHKYNASFSFPMVSSISQFSSDSRAFCDSLSVAFRPKQQFFILNSSRSGSDSSSMTKRRRSRNNKKSNTRPSSNNKSSTLPPPQLPEMEIIIKKKNRVRDRDTRPVDVSGLYQNQNVGDPLGRRDLGKWVVKWISQGMKAMASDLAMAEVEGEFSEEEVRQRMGMGMGPPGGGLTFVIQAQPYLNAVPMPLGLEAVCLKACTHYPTLFDHFQRELRDVLQDLHRNNNNNWRDTQSWKLLKDLANSAQHRAIARMVSHPKTLHAGLGMDLHKAKAIQSRIDDFTKRMSDLLRIERDAELEFTQEELNAVPTPDHTSDSPKPTEFLVTHGQAEQELCDTICNLNAVSTFTGLGGMHLVLFRVEGNHRLPPTTLSPGDMVCVRTCDSRGAGATSCMQGFVNNLGEDGCSISVALEFRHGDPTFSKLFGKSVRIDRIHGLADALTYEVSHLTQDSLA